MRIDAPAHLAASRWPISEMVRPLVRIDLPGGSGPGELADRRLYSRSPSLPVLVLAPPLSSRFLVLLLSLPSLPASFGAHEYTSMSIERNWTRVPDSRVTSNKSRMKRRTGA